MPGSFLLSILGYAAYSHWNSLSGLFTIGIQLTNKVYKLEVLDYLDNSLSSATVLPSIFRLADSAHFCASARHLACVVNCILIQRSSSMKQKHWFVSPIQVKCWATYYNSPINIFLTVYLFDLSDTSQTHLCFSILCSRGQWRGLSLI